MTPSPFQAWLGLTRSFGLLIAGSLILGAAVIAVIPAALLGKGDGALTGGFWIVVELQDYNGGRFAACVVRRKFFGPQR